MSYATITTEGGLLPADLLDQIAAGEVAGQQPRDFGLPATSRLSDEIAAAWGEARAYWNATQQSLARLRPDESTTRPARRWITALLEALGYRELIPTPTAARVESRTYAISHRAGRDESAPPVHIEGFGVDLDRRAPGGRPRLSPHALVQEYLNSTEHLWGIVTNGERLRLLRDSSQISRPRYVEFDLRGMFEGEKFNEFALMYRLLHRSRLPQSDADAATCLLEQYHQQAIQSGGRVRERLREGVEVALKTLGNGLLQHPYNAALRQKLQSGQLGALDYYRQLLRLVYRLLFLMVAEERGLIAVSDDIDDPFSPLHYRAPRDERLRIYLDYYSVSRLRRLAEAPGAGRAPYDDLWLGLLTTFRLLEGSDEQGARLLGLTPLNGDLFGEHAIRDLLDTRLRNDALLKAIHALSLYRDPQSRIQRRVNYAALDVEELGSVYESLLDYRPVVMALTPSAARPLLSQDGRGAGGEGLTFDLVAGTERKTTGSYYTHPSLVQELIRSALEPVIAERLRGIAASVSKTPQKHGGTEDPNESPRLRDSVVKQKEAALLSIKVCDPACGSGHFLLAAARRLGRELARIRSGEDQPTPGAYRQAVRDVIAHCIYGVDLNPLAVDLCKLALWIEGHNAGMPLSFLDHHIKWGNSLVGASAALVAQGIPDGAYKPVSGDDTAIAAALRKRNRQERDAWLKHRAVQQTLFATDEHADTRAQLAQALRDLEAQPDTTVAAIRAKAQRYAELQTLVDAERTRYHLWTAAFFQPLTAEHAALVPTTGTLIEHERAPKQLDDPRVAAAYALAREVGFFHWELEFPLVFHDAAQQASDAPQRYRGTQDSKGGFDVVLGNPPWERIKLQEEEFFTSHDQQIANAPNKAARARLIQELPKTNPVLATLFARAKHRAEAQSRFVRASGRFPLTAVGDVNTYALFAEHARDLLNDRGRAGIIVPTGIATDDSTKAFFGDVSQRCQLVSLFDFENREAIFPDVHRSYKFCLLTLGTTAQSTRFSFFLTDPRQVEDRRRVFELTAEEIALLNPNTRTVPVFRTRTDAELTTKIYRRVPVLVHESNHKGTKDTKEDPKENLRDLRASVVNPGNPWGVSFMRMFDMSNDSHLFHTAPGADRLPLYEAKLLHQFTHRWATYEHGAVRELTPEELADSTCTITPRYWVDRAEVEARLAGRWSRRWLLGFRDIARATDERTAIFSLLPRVAVGHTSPLIFLEHARVVEYLCFLATVNSITFDFATRQKLGGTHLTFTVLNQLPVLPPTAFSAEDIAFIVPRVLELVYTAWDMRPFAEDVWAELDASARALVLARWKANHKDTKHTKETHNESSCPLCLCGDYDLSPFTWHEERRAVIRAELDARIARLYGLNRDELRYILDPQEVMGEDFPSETFRVLKEKELRQYGEYRTRRLVLEAWDRENGS
ncbi:Eco57I restriction-modification methylase domain-containing protein [Kallotenue papyrolyticum]|uniref:Eco57I restriction-modification methylase domain-containing protein n=1 Tax=Kallotenue papyrolyticum TaxID=1325125 RepID=UPI000492930C|nr:DNA methyltransferase [Kallotenue papyrolyticum]